MAVRRAFICFALAAALASCGASDRRAVADAEAAVRAKLSDPESAKFRNTRTVTSRTEKGSELKAVCGEVGSRNRMGGYDGYAPFAYVVAHTYAVPSKFQGNPPKMVRIASEGQTGTDRDVARLCGPDGQVVSEDDLNLYDAGL